MHSLREDIDDEALEAALVAHFGKVSRVWCKIRRQANNVPFAIMTYAVSLLRSRFPPHRNAGEPTTMKPADSRTLETCLQRKEHAETAREVYHGAKIHGRPCRVEKLQANRHWIIWKKEGKIMPLEATQAMVPLGDVATVKHISIEDAEKLDVPTSAMVVTFVKWDPARQVAKVSFLIATSSATRHVSNASFSTALLEAPVLFGPSAERPQVRQAAKCRLLDAL